LNELGEFPGFEGGFDEAVGEEEVYCFSGVEPVADLESLYGNHWYDGREYFG